METVVRLRDPSDVAVQVALPSGTETILSARTGERSVPLPRSVLADVPVENEHEEPDVWVVRNTSAQLTLHCAQCDPKAHELGDTLTIRGSAADTLAWTDRELRIRYPYMTWDLEGRTAHTVEAFPVTLATPRSNVLEARRVVHVDRGFREDFLRIGIGATVIGLGLETLGVLMAAGVLKPASGSDAGGQAAIFVVGGVITTFGLVIGGNAIRAYVARDVDEAVVPAPR
jgi:hypothetical protein